MNTARSKHGFLRCDKQEILKSDECIVLYEKGSGGNIVGVYYSLMEYSDKEQRFIKDNKNISRANARLLHTIHGTSKSTFCHHLNMNVTGRIRKISEVNLSIHKIKIKP